MPTSSYTYAHGASGWTRTSYNCAYETHGNIHFAFAGKNWRGWRASNPLQVRLWRPTV